MGNSNYSTKDIPGYEGYYVATIDGRIYSIKRNKHLKPYLNGGGREVVTLSKGGLQTKYSVAKLIYLSYFGLVGENLDVEHKDRDFRNNKPNNLRLATRSQNMANIASRRNSSSTYKGVCWSSTRNKWVAHVKVNYKQKYLGSFTNEIEAAKAYNRAAKQYFGEFALTNTIA